VQHVSEDEGIAGERIGVMEGVIVADGLQGEGFCNVSRMMDLQKADRATGWKK
jgi:hypothetical protein